MLNGDTITWSLFVQGGPRDEAIALLRETLRRDGVAAVLLAGNADDRIADARSCRLAGGRVLAFHGHAVFEGLSPWRDRAGWMERQRQAALAAMSPEEADSLDGQLLAVDRGLSDLHGPQRPRGAARAWAMRFAPVAEGAGPGEVAPGLSTSGHADGGVRRTARPRGPLRGRRAHASAVLSARRRAMDPQRRQPGGPSRGAGRRSDRREPAPGRAVALPPGSVAPPKRRPHVGTVAAALRHRRRQ